MSTRYVSGKKRKSHHHQCELSRSKSIINNSRTLPRQQEAYAAELQNRMWYYMMMNQYQNMIPAGMNTTATIQPEIAQKTEKAEVKVTKPKVINRKAVNPTLTVPSVKKCDKSTNSITINNPLRHIGVNTELSNWNTDFSTITAKIIGEITPNPSKILSENSLRTPNKNISSDDSYIKKTSESESDFLPAKSKEEGGGDTDESSGESGDESSSSGEQWPPTEREPSWTTVMQMMQKFGFMKSMAL